MGLNDHFADGQAQAAVTAGARPRFVGAVEPLEDVGHILRSDADAGIGHAQDRMLVFHTRGDPNLTMILVVLNGIGQQVRHDLGEPVGVA